MAQMIPDAMPPGSSTGEKLLFSRLQSLPDDCIVYYEPPVGSRYPDFLVILPDCGLLVVEAKGWRSTQVLGGDSRDIRVRVSASEGEKRATNPVRQAREYMYILMNTCRKSAAATQLLHKEGRHAGEFVFPFGFCAVLTQINEEELQRHPAGDMRTILPSNHVIASDEFDAWGAFTPEQLKARLASFFDPAWPFPPLTKSQINALRSILHPEVLVPPTPAEVAEMTAIAEQVLLFARTCDIATLDLEQERAARELGSGHRLLFGVAGSGKTVILVSRATYLARAYPSGRILVLCFNVTFRSYLRALLASCGNVDVYTFHGWGFRNGIRRTEGESQQAYGERFLESLRAGNGDAGGYDAILIDEAQDFEPSWFQCATEAMKEPRHGDLLIVGDGSQTSYGRGSPSWAKLGIAAQGRTKILKNNYRNTKSIVQAAAPFADDNVQADTIPATRCDVSRALRDSRVRPVLVECSTRNDEFDVVERTVRDLLSGAFASPDVPPLRPSDIGLLYRKDMGDIEQLVTRIGRAAAVTWLKPPTGSRSDDPRQKVIEPGIKVQTIHAAKGLQYRAVILLSADQLGGARGNEKDDRRLLYVALTRPEDVLVVTCVRQANCSRSPLIDQMIASGAYDVTLARSTAH